MPTNEAKGILNDIGTEELAHLEMIGAIVYQLTRGVPADVLERVGLGAYYTDHDHAVYPMSASGTLLPQHIYSQKVIPSPTCMKTWPQNKKPVPLMKTL